MGKCKEIEFLCIIGHYWDFLNWTRLISRNWGFLENSFSISVFSLRSLVDSFFSISTSSSNFVSPFISFSNFPQTQQHQHWKPYSWTRVLLSPCPTRSIVTSSSVSFGSSGLVKTTSWILKWSLPSVDALWISTSSSICESTHSQNWIFKSSTFWMIHWSSVSSRWIPCSITSNPDAHLIEILGETYIHNSIQRQVVLSLELLNLGYVLFIDINWSFSFWRLLHRFYFSLLV